MVTFKKCGGILSERIPHIYSQKTLWADMWILSKCGGILSEGCTHTRVFGRLPKTGGTDKQMLMASVWSCSCARSLAGCRFYLYIYIYLHFYVCMYVYTCMHPFKEQTLDLHTYTHRHRYIACNYQFRLGGVLLCLLPTKVSKKWANGSIPERLGHHTPAAISAPSWVPATWRCPGSIARCFWKRTQIHRLFIQFSICIYTCVYIYTLKNIYI